MHIYTEFYFILPKLNNKSIIGQFSVEYCGIFLLISNINSPYGLTKMQRNS